MPAFSFKNLMPQETNVKNLLWWLLGFALFFYGVNQMVNAGNSLYNRGLAIEHTVSFSGEGKVKAVPDTASFEAGLVTEGKESITVQRENSEKMNNIIKYLKSRGVADADIKTSQYNLSPKYEYVKGKTNLVGYTLNQTLTVIVRDLDKVGELLDGVVANGANQIYSVSLFIDKPEELQAQARAKAIEEARLQALSAAQAAGFKLGRLVSFSEGPGFEPPIFFRAMESKGVGGAVPAPPQIEPGSQEVMASVTLTYQIR